MNATAFRFSSSLVSAAAAALLMSVGVSAQAQELQPAPTPYGTYVGATAGIGLNNWKCDVSCDRGGFAGKVFFGKRLTPGLAAEINYFMFGSTKRTNSGPTAKQMGYESQDRRASAWTVGINWEVDLINDFTNQIRVGVAAVKHKNDYHRGANTTREDDNFVAPYIGAGIAFRLTNNIKLLSNADIIQHSDKSEYLFSVGAMAEF